MLGAKQPTIVVRLQKKKQAMLLQPRPGCPDVLRARGDNGLIVRGALDTPNSVRVALELRQGSAERTNVLA